MKTPSSASRSPTLRATSSPIVSIRSLARQVEASEG
jgi:hypothetical protein